jgi:hypothetical protein
VANASAYEVWMGTHLMRSADATNLSTWALTASQLEGFNVNRAPHDTDPASNDQYRTIFAQFTNARSTITEFARSQATRNPANTDELAFPSIAQRLGEIFADESSFGYKLTAIMFYDERGTYQGTEYLYEWTDIEIQYMRDWLDANGHADVKLMWNVRNNSVRNQQIAAKTIVDSVEIEASTTALLANTNNQITFFTWFWNNSATAHKPIALQIPRTLDSLDQYKGTRRVAQMLGGIIGYGENGMRSNRLIFLPVTYNDNYAYLPETQSPTLYKNTLTSICLSLIEQRALFEGRTRTPTIADADSYARQLPPTVSPVADQILAANSTTGPLAFTIGDDLTAPSALTLIKSSSNTTLVPLANVVLGGTGANRTVAVAPAAGQSGSAVISILVSDGTLGTPVTFTVTVLPPGIMPGTLFSTAADCSIREDLTIEKLPDATLDVGCRGTSPFIERCTVYVFQLPNLGAVANPFTGAAFAFNFISKAGTLRGYDLYGLGRRTSATVLTSDYYALFSTADPTDATRLQQSILTGSTPTGVVSTTAGGNSNLVTYLNAQYAGGAGAGQHVFLRINSRSAKGTSASYATITMSEGGAAGPPDTRPRITYQAVGNTPPVVSSIADQTITANTTTGPLAFTVSDDSTPAGSITLGKTSSNTSLVPLANIVFGGSGASRTVTVTPAANQTGSAVISVIAGDGSLSATDTFTLTVLPQGTVTSTLYSELADSGPRQVDGAGPSILASTATDPTLYAGRSGTGGTVDRCIVLPFQLPDLGVASNPFSTASFTFHLVSNDFSPTVCNLDLYGLTNRGSATVLASDFYSETNVADPAAGTTRLQDDICNQSSPAGNYTSSAAANSGLVAYLNAQYAGGANAGKFVFLRLSKDTAVGAVAKKFTVTAADGASTANAGQPDYAVWPQLDYTAVRGNHAPALSAISNSTLIAGQTLTFTATATDSDAPAQTLSFSLVNPPAGAAVDAASGAFTWRPTLAQAPSAQTLTVRVTDNGAPSLSATRNFQVTVAAPAQPAISSLGMVAGGGGSTFSMTISGDAGPDYTIWASPNLTDWAPILTIPNATPPYQFTDPSAGLFPQRFYRIQLGP